MLDPNPWASANVYFRRAANRKNCKNATKNQTSQKKLSKVDKTVNKKFISVISWQMAL